MNIACHPGVDHVSPLLQQVQTLLDVLSFVVDAARRTAVFVRQALLDPFTVEVSWFSMVEPSKLLDKLRIRANAIVQS
ncbi:MAG: hypothetical protein ACK41V_07110 [Acidovorax sp.]|uniref:hypothetical protein n=1 Tax=Acidovorax sp. TaxID=1872122 RepID=UPI00391BEAC1